MVEFVFQAITTRTHADIVAELLRLQGLRRAIISAAFANANGVALIEERLEAVKDRVDAFVGIRNDITSTQALKRLLPLVHHLFVFDTGSRNRIFHPKIYMARSDTSAQVVVGSANLTTGGLWNNIEASLKFDLDLRLDNDRATVQGLENSFDSLPPTYPEHVVRITTEAQVDDLLRAGRVTDESVSEPPRPAASRSDRTGDIVPRIRLPLTPRFPVIQRVRAPRAARQLQPVAAPGVATPDVRASYTLVWESNPLTRRDLNIPTGANTNPTGSMLFKKGRMDGIDQRHFFRDDVFSALNWQPDAQANRQHLERAGAPFRLVIKNIDYGESELRLTHNTDTQSRSYEQLNAMTQIHWGNFREHVSREDLLDRTLYLFRSNAQPDHFMIEID